jgi:hypothetical protein
MTGQQQLLSAGIAVLPPVFTVWNCFHIWYGCPSFPYLSLFLILVSSLLQSIPYNRENCLPAEQREALCPYGKSQDVTGTSIQQSGLSE